MTAATLDIVPPQRLGLLLSRARDERGLTLDDVARRGPFDATQLAEVESGARPLTDDTLEAVLVAYGTTVDELLPARSQVVLDLEQGRLLVADEAAPLEGAPTPDEVLGAYLSLVYSLRRAQPGSRVVLRGFDVAVLAKALHLSEPDVERRLEGLMASPTPEVSRLTRILRSKLAVPVAGAVVVATALGTVLVLRNDERPAPPPTGVQRTEVPDAELLPPLVMERNPDGTPQAPVQVSNN